MIARRPPLGQRASRQEARAGSLRQDTPWTRVRRGTPLSRPRHVALISAVAAGLLFAHLASGGARPQQAFTAANTFPATPAQSVTAPAVTALDGRLPVLHPDSPRDLTLQESLQATQHEHGALVAIEPPTRGGSAPPAAAAVSASTPAAIASRVMATPPAAIAETSAATTAAAMPVAMVAARATDEPPTAPAAVPAVENRYATRTDLIDALARTRWDPAQWQAVIAIAFCESGMDTDRDGLNDVTDTHASGASGRYLGVLQIAQEHRFSAPYDLRSLVGNLAAGYELWRDNGRSFAPWGCH